MSKTPRPEFGKPETGRIRYWFRTDAQMRRAYMAPDELEREIERIRIRRAQLREAREQAREYQRRATHRHTLCHDCVGGLVDVGALSGKSKERQTDRAGEVPCCSCLAMLARPRGGRSRSMEWGPHHDRLRCRVLDPDVVDETVGS